MRSISNNLLSIKEPLRAARSYPYMNQSAFLLTSKVPVYVSISTKVRINAVDGRNDAYCIHGRRGGTINATVNNADK